MSKDLYGGGVFPPLRGADSIITAPLKQHARIRKSISYAFSEKSLREQEGFLHTYVDKLISRLYEVAPHGPQDVVN